MPKMTLSHFEASMLFSLFTSVVLGVVTKRTDRDRLTSQSMAKTVLAMLIGIAIDEGSIRSIDDAASVYVPELAGTELGRTPLRALLHMASGIAFTEVYDGYSKLLQPV